MTKSQRKLRAKQARILASAQRAHDASVLAAQRAARGKTVHARGTSQFQHGRDFGSKAFFTHATARLDHAVTQNLRVKTRINQGRDM